MNQSYETWKIHNSFEGKFKRNFKFIYRSTKYRLYNRSLSIYIQYTFPYNIVPNRFIQIFHRLGNCRLHVQNSIITPFSHNNIRSLVNYYTNDWCISLIVHNIIRAWIIHVIQHVETGVVGQYWYSQDYSYQRKNMCRNVIHLLYPCLTLFLCSTSIKIIKLPKSMKKIYVLSYKFSRIECMHIMLTCVVGYLVYAKFCYAFPAFLLRHSDFVVSFPPRI